VARQSSLRASDADRDAVAERLRVAAVEGRLEPHELEQRMGIALRARTYGELDRLLADLPGGARRAVTVAPRAVLPVAARIAFVLAVLALVPVLLAVGTAWLVLWAVVFLVLRASRGCSSPKRVHRRPHASW
jgi:hypothetical protein